MYDHLDDLEAQSVYIFREAYRKFENLAMLYSIGKDSTTMIHLARKAGLKRVTEQGEVDAHLQLEATSHAAVAREALEDQIALADLLFKQQFQWLFARSRAA